MLLIGAGLLTRTLLRLYAIDPGFNLANVLSLQAPDFSVPNRDRRVQFSRDVLERLRTEPAVQGAALASAAPLVGSFPFQQQIRVDGGDPDAAGSTPRTTTRIVSTGYFETIGARIKEGRSFQATDGANSARVVILSESMARFYFKNHEAVGRHISWKQFNGNWTQPAEIVGVAADNRSDGITETPLHTLYQLDTQSTPVSTLLLRTAGSPGSLTPHVIETIRQLDPNRPIDHVQTLEEIRDESIAPQRLNATLIGLFALLALAIATVGVAGVLAFSVSQRTNELGIRLALGAKRATILRMILGEGATMAVIGLTIGGLAALPLSRLLTGLLVGVEPLDPATIALSAVLLVGVALVASWIPARTATAVDPMTALRGE